MEPLSALGERLNVVARSVFSNSGVQCSHSPVGSAGGRGVLRGTGGRGL